MRGRVFLSRHALASGSSLISLRKNRGLAPNAIYFRPFGGISRLALATGFAVLKEPAASAVRLIGQSRWH